MGNYLKRQERINYAIGGTFIGLSFAIFFVWNKVIGAPIWFSGLMGILTSLGSVYYFQRARDYRVGRKGEEIVEEILKTCIPNGAKLYKDLKLKYGNADFVLEFPDTVVILEVKTGKVSQMRLENTRKQVELQVKEISERFGKRTLAHIVWVGEDKNLPKSVGPYVVLHFTELCSFLKKYE